jgi:type II secretory pathway component GspD/PulD (secretin)
MKKVIFLTFILLIPFAVCAQNTAPISPAVQQRGAQNLNFCDPGFVGEPISFMQTAELTLDDLLSQIYSRFGVNFMIGPNVSNLPINVKTSNIPWNTLLNSQLYLLGVRATCVNGNTIQLVKNDAQAVLEQRELQTAKLGTYEIKLKYLQPTTSGTRNLAGERTNQGGSGGQCGGNSGANGGNNGGGSGGNCGTFEQLKYEIEKILGLHDTTLAFVPNPASDRSDGNQTASGDVTTVGVRKRGSVSVIPGRNILLIRGTEDQLRDIRRLIELADRPPFQVIIKGLVYTANENRLRDIGVQTSITARTADNSTRGGIFGQGIGGIGTLFDFSTIIGTSTFSVQASALEQNGVISIKSRPFAIVLDGDAAALEVGRQIPVLTQGSVVGGDAGDLEFIGASNLLSVTPHVIDDDNGNPVAVNLELQLESNEVDLSVISQGVPSITRRSIQSKLILTQDKTVILGGFTVDSNNNTVSKTPVLGDIPILGYLFKRRIRADQINRLYFAISVSVVPYGSVLEPVVVPGATTDIPSITPEMLKRAKEAPSVVSPVIDKP